MLTSIRVQGYRSIEDSGTLPLGRITLAIGRNNSGKSALIRAAYLLQDSAIWQPEDRRIGSNTTIVELGFDVIPTAVRVKTPTDARSPEEPGKLVLTYDGNTRQPIYASN